MPIPIAQQDKRALRALVQYRAGDYWPLSTSGAGNAGGTTAVFASLTGRPRTGILDRYLLLTSGTNDGTWRAATDFDTANGTITVPRAYTGQVLTSVTAELMKFRPDLYTHAMNEAITECFPDLYRSILHHAVVRETAHRVYPQPRNMRRVVRVLEDATSSEELFDFFDRVNSTTAPGAKWTADVGTGGITSESLYFPGDTTGDTIVPATNPQVKNGIIQAVVRGDTTDTASRVISFEFRREDASNFLFVRLLNGQVDLRKRDAGTDSSLTTGTVTTTEDVDYVVRVMFTGSWVRVWVDDVELITYELLGLNLKYLGYDESGTGTYGNVGFRLDKAGTPSLGITSTLVRDYRLHELVGTSEWTDWRQSADGRTVELGVRRSGRSTSTKRLLWFEGLAPMTTLTADTTFETLASDTTDVVEIETTDPAMELLVLWATYALYKQAAQPGNMPDEQERARVLSFLPAAEAAARAARARHAMPYPKAMLRSVV